MATLEYETRSTVAKAPPPRWVYWLAVICGGWPAVAGVGITVLYLLTWWGALPMMGLMCMLAGLISVVVGAVLLLTYGVGQWRRGTGSKKRLRIEVGLAGLVLVVNFPLALVCMLVGDGESAKVQVTLVNETNGPVTAVTLISNGASTVVGDLPAKSQRKLITRLPWETEFKGTAITGGVTTEFMIDPYPEGGPQRKTLRFKQPATRPVVE